MRVRVFSFFIYGDDQLRSHLDDSVAVPSTIREFYKFIIFYLFILKSDYECLYTLRHRHNTLTTGVLYLCALICNVEKEVR